MKSKSVYLFTLILLLIVSTSCSLGRKFKFNTKNLKIALIVSGNINDSSWNKAAYQGLKRFQNDHKNIEISVVERVTIEESEDVLINLAKRKYNLILAHGYNYTETVVDIAENYKSTFFCVVGGNISQEPNLCSFNFKDEQYGYLVGVVAGLNTVTNKVGIVVGNKLPSVERTIIGIRKGLKTVNPKADLVVSYINSWTDVTKARQAAINQINTGVDIITHLADSAGSGVIKAAQESDISAIGAIIDQHDIAPSAVISSGIQDASQLIYLVCEKYLEKSLKPEIYRYGLKDQVVDLASSYGNIDPTISTRINKYKNFLIDLEIKQEEHNINQRK